jgi:hypothetical protein
MCVRLTGLRAGHCRNRGSITLQGEEISLFSSASRPSQPSPATDAGSVPLGVKLPGREIDHSPPSGAEVKNE